MLLLVFAVTLIIAVLLSALAERTVLSATVLFLVAGVLLGSGWLGGSLAPNVEILNWLAQLALFSVLFTDGMHAGGTPAPVRSRGLVVRALAAGMPLTIAGIAAGAHYLAGFTWLEGLLLGAVLSPTDPVFVAAIFRFEAVPLRLRRLLNVESGINDGVALPLVIILLAAVGGHSPHLMLVAWELVAGIGIGIVIPWVGIRLEASRYFGSAGVFRPLNAFALGLLVLAVSLVVHVNIYLAAFGAGVTVARMSPALHASFAQFGEIVAELLKLAAILIFGLEFAPSLLLPLSLGDVAVVVLSLFLVRLVAIAIAFLGSGLPAGETLAAGWFGPKGFASVVYGLMILGLGTDAAEAMGHLVGLTIVLSIVVYSSTDILVGRWFQRRSALAG